jgi:hypothetical protein
MAAMLSKKEKIFFIGVSLVGGNLSKNVLGVHQHGAASASSLHQTRSLWQQLCKVKPGRL